MFRLISNAWITSFLPSAPCFFIFELTIKEKVANSVENPMVLEECTSDFSGWPLSLKKAYFTAVFLIIFVIPLAIMFCLYTHILVQLRDKARDNKRARLLELGEQHQVIFCQYLCDLVIVDLGHYNLDINKNKSSKRCEY